MAPVWLRCITSTGKYLTWTKCSRNEFARLIENISVKLHWSFEYFKYSIHVCFSLQTLYIFRTYFVRNFSRSEREMKLRLNRKWHGWNVICRFKLSFFPPFSFWRDRETKWERERERERRGKWRRCDASRRDSTRFDAGASLGRRGDGGALRRGTSRSKASRRKEKMGKRGYRDERYEAEATRSLGLGVDFTKVDRFVEDRGREGRERACYTNWCPLRSA